MKNPFGSGWSICAVLLAVGFASAERLQPSDLEYLGAFRVPSQSGWDFGGEAFTYYPHGDSKGPDDGFPGSLYASGRDGIITEFTIPAPVKSPGKNLDALPRAQTLQGFQNLRPFELPYGDPRLDLEYLPKQGSQTTDKLYYCWGSHYSFGSESGPSMAWSELNLSTPKIAGGWYLHNGGETQLTTFHISDYLFSSPEAWAQQNTPGKLLISGRFRDGGVAGKGPTMYAFGPWNDGNPPASGAKLKYTPLLHYTDSHPFVGYSDDDAWKGGAFLTTGEKSAIVLVGTKSIGKTWYGENPVCGGSKGFWSDKTQGQIIFYDTDEIGQVAKGQKKPHEPQPYATLNIDPFLWKEYCTNEHNHTDAMAYDRKSGHIFIFEPVVEPNFNPIVHVFRLQTDNTPPSKVMGLKTTIEETSVTLSWNAATDAESGISGYEIFRGDSPSAMPSLARVFNTQSYVDKTGLEDARLYYAVKAINGAGLTSAQPSETVSVVTGGDVNPPTVESVQSAGNQNTLMVFFSEKVDPASATIPLNYAIDNGVTVHSAKLQEDGRTVLLSTSEHKENSQYHLTVKNVADLSKRRNAIAQKPIAYRVTNKLDLQIVRPTGYQAALGKLNTGEPVYGDRDFKLAKTFDGYQPENFHSVKTFNDDKGVSTPEFLVMESNLNVEVLVGVANAQKKLSGESPLQWMKGWINTGHEAVREPINFGSFVEEIRYTFYSKSYPKGKVVLGGNYGQADNMYVVLVQPYQGLVGIDKESAPQRNSGNQGAKPTISGNKFRLEVKFDGALNPTMRVYDVNGALVK